MKEILLPSIIKSTSFKRPIFSVFFDEVSDSEKLQPIVRSAFHQYPLTSINLTTGRSHYVFMVNNCWPETKKNLWGPRRKLWKWHIKFTSLSEYLNRVKWNVNWCMWYFLALMGHLKPFCMKLLSARGH